MTTTGSTDHSLWAIAAYFNPRHYQRRLANYRVFRKHLAVPLLTVELSFDGTFELSSADADMLIALRTRDVMWQKERLLNVAAALLPAGCKNVVWLDCDSVLSSDEWPGEVCQLLDEFPLVQPVSRVHHLQADAMPSDARDAAAIEFTQISIPLAVAAGQSPRDCMSGVRVRLDGSCVMGMGWAMRRDTLQEVGLYDAGIVGGGTRPLVCAAYGCYDEAIKLNQFNEHQAAHYLKWAKRFFRAIGGNVAAAPGDAFHLWHGAMADRRYKERYEGLTRHCFNPEADLALAANGTWRWNSDKPVLHQYVADYFAARKEDGEVLATSHF